MQWIGVFLPPPPKKSFEINKLSNTFNDTQAQYTLYKVTQKEWDCKDDLKLLIYKDSYVELILFSYLIILYGIFNDWSEKPILSYRES